MAPLLAVYGSQISVMPVGTLHEEWRRAAVLPELLAWFEGTAWRRGYALNNLGNGLRLVLMSLRGGRYFDLDVVHVRSTNCLVNVTARQSSLNINNAAMAFSARHPFVQAVAQDFVRHFDGMSWGNNGPSRVTRTYTQACAPPVGTAAPPTPDPRFECDSVTVLEPASFYPHLYGRDTLDRFYSGSTPGYLSSLSNTYGVHLWQSAPISNTTVVREGSAMHQLAAHACPLVLHHYGLRELLPKPEHIISVRSQPVPRELQAPAVWTSSAMP